MERVGNSHSPMKSYSKTNTYSFLGATLKTASATEAQSVLLPSKFRIYSQKMTVTARELANKKTFGHLSYLTAFPWDLRPGKQNLPQLFRKKTADDLSVRP